MHVFCSHLMGIKKESNGIIPIYNSTHVAKGTKNEKDWLIISIYIVHRQSIRWEIISQLQYNANGLSSPSDALTPVCWVLPKIKNKLNKLQCFNSSLSSSTKKKTQFVEAEQSIPIYKKLTMSISGSLLGWEHSTVGTKFALLFPVSLFGMKCFSRGKGRKMNYFL